MLFECGYGTFEQGAGYLRIPLGHHDTEAHVAGIGHLVEIVVREVMKCGCHFFGAIYLARSMYLSISLLMGEATYFCLMS